MTRLNVSKKNSQDSTLYHILQTSNRGHHLQLQQHHCRINSYQHSFFPSGTCGTNCHQTQWGLNRSKKSVEQTRLPHAVKPLILDHVLSALHHALFLPVFTNVFYFYTNFISSTPLLRIFYSWSKQKRIRTAWLTQEGCTITERKEGRK